jgi:hypothetical protein
MSDQMKNAATKIIRHFEGSKFSVKVRDDNASVIAERNGEKYRIDIAFKKALLELDKFKWFSDPGAWFRIETKRKFAFVCYPNHGTEQQILQNDFTPTDNEIFTLCRKIRDEIMEERYH